MMRHACVHASRTLRALLTPLADVFSLCETRYGYYPAINQIE